MAGDTEQIANTGVLLAILVLYLIYDFRPRFAAPGEPAAGSVTWGLVGFGLLAGAAFFQPSLPSLFLLLAGVGCLFRAGVGTLLHPTSRPLLNALFVAFTLFGALLVALPLLDVPLRIIAGRWSAQLLMWLQQETNLGWVIEQGQALLILVVNGRPFHVAAECNGFGLLGTSLLLNAAFILYRRVGWLDGMVLVGTGVFLAVVGNLLRILVIVGLAPHVGDHYYLMHELVGTIVFYAALGFQWWLLVGFGRSPRPARSENSEDHASS